MSVYLKIDTCLQCPYFGRKGFFDGTPTCKQVKKELPHTLHYTPPFGRSMGATVRTPTGEIPGWCPLRKTVADASEAS